MQKISWNQFKVKNENPTKSFENLCYHLFCRKFSINEGIKADFNQAGLETEPIFFNGKHHGFQAKFFEPKIDYSQIKKSVKIALKRSKGRLDRIHIYINVDCRTSSQAAKDIVKLAQKDSVEVEWIVKSNFEILLNQPSNLDLTQLYFGLGDELGFIESSCNPEILTFLLSSNYLTLPFKLGNKSIQRLRQSILRYSQSAFLLTGSPGSGKTIFMHKLLQEFGGLNKDSKNHMLDILEKNQAVPIQVNLKNCATDSLENILRGRQNDSRVRGKQLGFIYLFDGLDELSERRADHVLAYMHELKQQNSTRKIIISCRSGNMNKVKAKIYFPELLEYQIDNLNEKFIKKYFDARNDTTKINQLKKLKGKNHALINEIKDILLIQLLWETIRELDEKSNVLDLLEKKIKLLLNEPKHKKNIEDLNLPNPKEEKIIALNQDISFEFQKRYQFRFSEKSLQELILSRFPRIDYESANAILNYLADFFFENSYSRDSKNQTFIYQHRRYQEIFFVQKLKAEYEKHPRILRDLRVLSNRDLFELFLKYLKKEYQIENDLPKLIELNLIDLYLGRRIGWEADEPFYMNSSEFIPALVNQSDLAIEELVADDNLQIEKKIIIDLREIRKEFDSWSKDKNNYSSSGYLKSVWEKGIVSLLENITSFWMAGRKSIAKKLGQNLHEIEKLFKEQKFKESLGDNEYLRDPFWDKLESWLYILIVIEGRRIKEVFDRLIRSNYQNFPDQSPFAIEESGKEKAVKSFLRVCVRGRLPALFKLVLSFDEYEFIAFLGILSAIDLLPIFVKETSIHERMRDFVARFDGELSEKNDFILFYRRFFKIQFSEKDTSYLNKSLEKLWNERDIDLRTSGNLPRYALLSYSAKRHTFPQLFEYLKSDIRIRYYNERALYSALFHEFIEMLRGEVSIQTIIRDYHFYIHNFTDDPRHYFRTEISSLWADIFVHCNHDFKNLIALKDRLILKDRHIAPFSFLLRINKKNMNLFNKLVNESDLQSFEDEIKTWDDEFPFYIDRFFEFASLFSNINQQKAISYIYKGINEGILRHGWHKDVIVSYLLVDALEILWRNNCETKEKLKEYTQEVFKLALRVRKITDGSDTWQGPYNVVNLLAKYDIQLAERFKKDLIADEGSYNFSNDVITSILLGKAKLGLPLDEIEEGTKEYRVDYDSESKPFPDSYEEKFGLYLSLAQNDLYTEAEKKKAFEKAYEQIEEMKKLELRHFLGGEEYSYQKQAFSELCKKYDKQCNLTFKKEQEKGQLEKPKANEKDFIKEISEVNTKQKITALYKKLNNYDNRVILEKHESWEILVNKTYQIHGNINSFIKLLQENSFPATDYMTSNSRYFHFGLAAALKKVNTRHEAIKYLYEYSGHGGFVNVMKAYEVNGDREMCLDLFKHFLKFCDFLVN